MRTFLKKLHHILPTSRMTQLVVFLAFCSRCFCFHKRNLFAHYYYIKETKSEPHPLYKLHNFRNTSSEAFRLVKFIQARKLNPRGRNLDFFSVYGSKKAFQYSSHPKIFFNGEPTTHQGKYRFQEYGDYCLDLVDLALGFKNLNAENALRFPLYLMFFIQPEMSDREISALCSTINQRDLIISQQRKKFATLIARHNDPQQIRSKTFKKLHKIGRIDCP
ncbi:MAG: hypothetical protein LBU27_09645 [Candidatus Peribacteria bacterium]|nr:hypothetical protein [Candidatus Peribacteria bacterium]